MVATARPARAKLQQLLLHIGGNVGVAGVLHVAPVDAEGGQALLVVAGQHGRQVDRAGPLGAVEAPHRLGDQRVHVHRFASRSTSRA